MERGWSHYQINLRLTWSYFNEDVISRLVSSCFMTLGLRDMRIPDMAFSSSSILTQANAPSRARLHLQIGKFQAAGWAPARGDNTPWLQVDLGNRMIIAGIGTQGGHYFWWSTGGWIQKFKVSFKSDGEEWQIYGQNTSEEVGKSNFTVLLLLLEKHVVTDTGHTKPAIKFFLFRIFWGSISRWYGQREIVFKCPDFPGVLH